MIISFSCKETLSIFRRGFSRKFPSELQSIAMRKLWIINAAKNINDLRVPPSNHLELLKGSRRGQYSIRINKKFRICFNWDKNNAEIPNNGTKPILAKIQGEISITSANKKLFLLDAQTLITTPKLFHPEYVLAPESLVFYSNP